MRGRRHLARHGSAARARSPDGSSLPAAVAAAGKRRGLPRSRSRVLRPHRARPLSGNRLRPGLGRRFVARPAHEEGIGAQGVSQSSDGAGRAGVWPSTSGRRSRRLAWRPHAIANMRKRSIAGSVCTTSAGSPPRLVARVQCPLPSTMDAASPIPSTVHRMSITSAGRSGSRDHQRRRLGFPERASQIDLVHLRTHAIANIGSLQHATDHVPLSINTGSAANVGQPSGDGDITMFILPVRASEHCARVCGCWLRPRCRREELIEAERR